YFGTLTTKRAEFPYENGLMVLDYSTYFHKEDYELEYEVNDYETGKNTFAIFLKKFDIPERKTENKIRRFFGQKYKG
ncbi:MAG: CYTH domain-containing protein, partial [Bacillota bacterium]|nr:CYTH domain-containing protein [Bacillota bacterium]